MQVANLCVRSAKMSDERFCRSVDKNLQHLKKLNATFAMLVQTQAILLTDSEFQTIGYLRVEHIFLEIPYISWITVLPEFRNRGVGNLLLNELVRREKTLGAKYILSSAEPRSSDALAWHKRNEFYEIGILRRMNQDGADELFFRLDMTD